MPDADAAHVALDLSLDAATLTQVICDIESVSGEERRLADAVEAALRRLAHLHILRDGDTVVARTELGRARRVVLAGHLDTVPLADRSDGTRNLPVCRELRATPAGPVEHLVGRGTVDMKGGVAVMLRLAALVPEPVDDLTFCFYDCEEVDAERNGLRRVAEARPELLHADFAVLLEPTDAVLEGGCKGTLRAEVRTHGVAAHSARPWMGHNAIHDAAEILARLAAYQAREVTVEGLLYHEALQAVLVRGGQATNVIPDSCVVTVNYRYAPDRGAAEAEAHVREVFDGFEVVVVDNAAGARPGLDDPAVRQVVDALGVRVQAKQGWTDVARFAALGIPAVNFGPGDPLLAHMDDERAPVHHYHDVEAALLRWLRG